MADKKSSSPAIEQLPAILDKMLEGVQIIDENWRYVYLNEAVVRQSKKQKKDLLGKTMMEAYPGIDSTPLFTQLTKCMAEKVSNRIENEFLFPDGSKGWFLLSISPWSDGVMILSVDITQQKQAEIDLFIKIQELKNMTNEVLSKEVKLSEMRLQMSRLQEILRDFT